MREKKRSTRGLGAKKVVRVNISLSNSDSFKLNRLATACNMKHTTLAGLIVERALNDAETINKLQEEFCLYKAYKIIPIKDYTSNELHYVLEINEREDF